MDIVGMFHFLFKRTGTLSSFGYPCTGPIFLPNQVSTNETNIRPYCKKRSRFRAKSIVCFSFASDASVQKRAFLFFHQYLFISVRSVGAEKFKFCGVVGSISWRTY